MVTFNLLHFISLWITISIFYFKQMMLLINFHHLLALLLYVGVKKWKKAFKTLSNCFPLPPPTLPSHPSLSLPVLLVLTQHITLLLSALPSHMERRMRETGGTGAERSWEYGIVGAWSIEYLSRSRLECDNEQIRLSEHSGDQKRADPIVERDRD